MTSSQHFALSFFGPVFMGGFCCGFIHLIGSWLERHHLPPLVMMLVGGVGIAMATRWFVRNCISVACPFCGGKSYEIPDRGNRFMCRVCVKDH